MKTPKCPLCGTNSKYFFCEIGTNPYYATAVKLFGCPTCKIGFNHHDGWKEYVSKFPPIMRVWPGDNLEVEDGSVCEVMKVDKKLTTMDVRRGEGRPVFTIADTHVIRWPWELEQKGGEMKKYLFDMPPRDPARKPYAAGLPPEVDAWAKASKHRIGTLRSYCCMPQYSVFVGNVDMIAELCNLYDDYGFIAYGNTKGTAVQHLYNNLQMRKATVEDALRFLLGYLQDPQEVKKYAAAFGVDMAADGKEAL